MLIYLYHHHIKQLIKDGRSAMTTADLAYVENYSVNNRGANAQPYKPNNRWLEKVITKSQRCQRNWDLSKKIPMEDIKTMQTSVTQCSSKQNRVFYKTVFVTDRNIIEKIYRKTWMGGYVKQEDWKTLKGWGMSLDEIRKQDYVCKDESNPEASLWGKKTYDETHNSTNPQVLANLLVAFIRDRDPSEEVRTPEERINGRTMGGAENEHPYVKADEQVALGIAAGYLTLTSNMLGYSSGCCQCGDKKEVSELLGETEETLLLMGIGYPDSTRSRLEHHVTGRRFPSRSKEIIVEEIFE